ncbi:MAG: hypothetical protein LBH79_07770 [Nitrososphaerota archaeon]|nr:hypothetical protein [Nitrososphaerota archaeon]
MLLGIFFAMFLVCFSFKKSLLPANTRVDVTIVFSSASVMFGCVSINLYFRFLVKKYLTLNKKSRCPLIPLGFVFAPLIISLESIVGYLIANKSPIIPPSLNPYNTGF